MNKLQRMIMLAMSGLLLLLLVPMALAWHSFAQISANAERSAVAQEVLDSHMMLATEARELILHLDSGGAPDDRTGKEIAAALAGRIAHIRQHIAAEVGVIGVTGVEEEGEEFARLDRIAGSLASALQGNRSVEWKKEIDTAVAHEHGELEQLHLSDRQARQQIQYVLGATFLGAIALLIGGLFWLRRTLVVPTLLLLQGMQQLMAGDRSFRIKLAGKGPFQGLHKVFNRMAEQIATAAGAETAHREQLEQAVARGTADLERANGELVQAAGRRTQFLADISHELRTPLAIIVGESDVVLRNESALVEEYRESLARVRDQAHGMSRLVDDLLFMARNDASPAAARLKPIDFHRLIKTVSASLQPLLAADGGKLEFHSTVQSARILGDEGRLRQLLGILLDNAVHYSEQAPEIAISLDVSPDGFVLSVKDSGAGIDPADLPHVFERFRRGTRGIEQNGDGVGLGLPLAKAVAESHGGSIAIESVPGSGTNVVVLLPEAAAGRGRT